MLPLVKIFLIILIQLNIYLFLGNLLVFVNPKKIDFSAGFIIIAGFIYYHFLFWLISYPWALLDLPFSMLSVVWMILLMLHLLFAVLRSGHKILNSYKQLCRFVSRYPIQMVICLSLISVILIVVATNGLLDIDSQTYIGEVTTILDTDHILAFNPVTGLPLSRNLFLHRGCSMFGAESAFWCKYFSIHPLIYCRIIRSAMNPVLLLLGCYCLVRTLGFSPENSLIFIMISCPAFLLFDNSGYTNMRFLLHRGYEGKAYLSGVLIVFTALISIMFLKNRTKTLFAILFMSMIASLSISATALYLIPPIVIAILGAYILVYKRWRLILPTLILICPSVFFFIMQIAE